MTLYLPCTNQFRIDTYFLDKLDEDRFNGSRFITLPVSTELRALIIL